MWYSVLSYIKFLATSTNQHGVHSPFVYDLITKCFYNKKSFQEYTEIQDYRKNLLRNDHVIEITDLGSGSKVNGSKKRVVKDIAKNSGTRLKRAKLLFRISNYLKPEMVLELGTSLGIATQAIHLGQPKAQITSIEGCPNCSVFTKQRLQNYESIKILTGNFSTYLTELKNQQFDLIFFDGNHTKEATLQYFNLLLSSAHNDSVFIFDDIYWSKEMTEAWDIIKSHQKVTLSIDTFFWGLIFFRTEQKKEHFKIRV